MADFFLQMHKRLKTQQDVLFWEIYEDRLESLMKPYLTEEEYLLFLQFGKNLMSGDLTFHKEQEQHMTGELRKCIEEEKEVFRNKTKVYRALCLFASALIMIILV